MVCALKRIAVKVHNFAVHDRDLMQTSSLSGLDYTTHLLTVPTTWRINKLAENA